MVVLLKDESYPISPCQGVCLAVSVGAFAKAVTIKQDYTRGISSVVLFSLKHLPDAPDSDIAWVATACAWYIGVEV